MQTLLDPTLLFFAFGLLAGGLKSSLEIPPAISRFLSLYLLMSLGLKGGFALASAGAGGEVAASLSCAVALAVAVPAIAYALLRRIVPAFDAAALAATYGSVSAVTFITATHYLEGHGLAPGGHMAAALALMESPAILFALIAAQRLRQQASAGRLALDAGSGTFQFGGPPPAPLAGVLREVLTDGAQMLLLGALAIGMISGEAGRAAMQPFAGDLFKGMLAFFLLDMGLLTARSLASLKGVPRTLLLYAVAAPPAHAALAVGLAGLAGLSPGNGALLAVLAASASYIAVPAALRQSLPEARPALYVGLSLGLTFPLNIVFGIPAYTAMARAWLGH